MHTFFKALQEQRTEKEKQTWINTPPLVSGAMRPRSKLQSQKRRLLLPTIREGYEGLVRDMNQLNIINQTSQSSTLHSSQPFPHHEPCPHSLSSEAYLLSICHLAHPTSLSTSDIINPRQQDCLRLPRFSAHNETSPTNASLCQRKEKETVQPEMYADLTVYRGQQAKHYSCGEPAYGCLGAADPLEFLYSSPTHYTCQSGNRMQGLDWRTHKAQPRQWQADIQLRYKSGHPEHTDTATLGRDPSPSDLTQLPVQTGTLTQSYTEHLQATRSNTLNKETQLGKQRELEKEEKESSTAVHSLISQWIAECRCAWKEASVRACILPSITDM
ncbi:hypothetical protein UPYG_G00214310 [Umbra pygmaea]|uniref:Uncharacterized protein n=1 Tax=Umbra pygmaea TaxID=75934 RepID=A0ABD0XAZ8_UMBPY